MPVRLILTHENADFDAVASLLGMAKLDPTALPILPAHVNRNVRQFLLNMPQVLSAVSVHDHKRQPVEFIYVVDTQSFNSIRGMHLDTPVHFVDHHPLERQLKPHETFEGERVGANTTLLIERIRAQGIPINPLEATLLILGIYEDTGSLTFGETTVRDMDAAAWLLAQQADLDIVREYMSYPLLPEQKQIYDQLRQNARVVTIHEHSVLIALAETSTDIPEVSALAHKLRDLYDPEALLLVIQMGRNVQLIGRSGVDEIDVGMLAKHFGGGGHPRASAALMRDTQLNDVLPKLEELLPQIVQPKVRVGDIMSAGSIFTLDAATTIAETLALTKHMPHEGYPVIEEDKVVGLFTRHALDRARHHGLLQQTVREVMEVGHNWVHANDSLEVLRQQMVTSGWGQMPVVDEEQHLVGIVTRTDILRVWNESISHPHQLLLDKLKLSLPPDLWHLVETISQEARQQHIGLYLIGGFVRDLLLGIPNWDIDFVVEGNAIGFVTHLCATLGGTMRYHTQFNTAKWILDESVVLKLGYTNFPPAWVERLDFATARTEFYDEPTILPTVRQSSIKLDLHRRDFTINAMAIRLAPEPIGELLDFYNGERDLEEKTIRVLHSLSFIDDPTRMIRAVRFEQRLHFQIEARTAELIHSALPLLRRVSGDRLRNEMNLIMAETRPLRYFQRLDDLGILAALHPCLRVDAWFEAACRAVLYFRQKPVWELPADFENWRVAMFAVLTARCESEQLTEVGQVLFVSKANLRHLEAIRASYQTLLALSPDSKPSVIVELVESFEHVEWVVLWALMPFAYQRRWLEQFEAEWRYIRPTINGADLLKRGVPPTPDLRVFLQRLRDAWLDAEIKNMEDEAQFIEQFISEQVK